MGYEKIDLANIRAHEVIKAGLESQRVHRVLSARRNKSRKVVITFLRNKILAVRLFTLKHGENFYCRTLEFFYSRPA